MLEVLLDQRLPKFLFLLRLATKKDQETTFGYKGELDLLYLTLVPEGLHILVTMHGDFFVLLAQFIRFVLMLGRKTTV